MLYREAGDFKTSYRDDSQTVEEANDMATTDMTVESGVTPGCQKCIGAV